MNMRQLLSLSMDGLNVIRKFADLLQTEHAELYGAHLVSVGSCGLHTLHNAVKAGFAMWQMYKLLQALHYVFHTVPARREDFSALTGSTSFPLPFCGHRWVENCFAIHISRGFGPKCVCSHVATIKSNDFKIGAS